MRGPYAIDPAAFSPGSCIAYPPTRGDRHVTVFLDAGHGGRDPGGVGHTSSGQAIAEAPINLAVTDDARRLLSAAGFRVVVSRTRNSSVVRLSPADVSGQELSLLGAHADVVARDVCANKAHANVLIGIYMDAGGANEAGAITGYDPDRRFGAKNLKLADLLQRDVLAAMNAQGWQIPDGGVKSDIGLGSTSGSGSGLAAEAAAYGHLLLLGPAAPGYFSTPSEMPGAVIEPLFITDPFEGSLAVNAHAQQVIARGITQAVTRYFSRPRRRTPRHNAGS